MLLSVLRTIFHRELGESYDKNEINSFFFMLMEHHLGLQRFAMVLQPNLTITKEEETAFFSALSKLKKLEPIQYILGEAHFMGRDFIVNRHVLIPRPETEELIDWVLATKDKGTAGPRILDIGTGSGCIAINIALGWPTAQVCATDISMGAMEVATANAKKYGVQITLVQDDIAAPMLHDEFDIIVSNPPYVRETEKQAMHGNVLEYEPASALYVPDEDPLKFYKHICDYAKMNLSKKGILFLEINQYLAQETVKLLKENDFVEVELRKDIFGNFRFLKGIYP